MESNTEKKGWFGRNWKWLVPTVGCGGVLMCVACLALVFTAIFGAIKSSDVYQEALTRTQENPAAMRALGTPIEAGFLVGGSIEVTGSTGNADFSIPVSGPKASGKVYAVVRKSAGTWEFTTLQLELKGSGKRINLLKK